MTNRFDRTLRLGYGFSLIVLIIIGTLSGLVLNTFIKSFQAVQHSDLVLNKFERLLSITKDAETGQRGYLLTGRAHFLEPYNGAIKDALAITDELKLLTADNPTQQANLVEIRRVLGQRLNILSQLLEKKRSGGIVTENDLENGKSAMDALRLAVAKAENDEKIILSNRTVTFGRYSSVAPVIIVAAILLAIAISVYSFRNVTRDIRERERLGKVIEQRDEETQALNEQLLASNEKLSTTVDELRSAREGLIVANETLESRVVERTKALQDSQKETQALNEELIAVNEEMAATNEELRATNEELAENEQRLSLLLDELKVGEERSAKLAAIVESSDDAIIGKNLDGIITSWNRGARQIFGYSEEEIVGKSILKLIPEDRHHEEPIILSQLRAGKKIDHYETIRQTRDGRLINVSLTISPIHDKEGKVIGVSKIARDITEQKLDEQRKNDFIGMASHELKTPLTSLAATLQVLQQKLKNSPDQFIPTALEKVVQQTRKMTNLINGFLNVSRLESGKLEIEKEPFELNALIKETISDVQIFTSIHQIVFETNVPVQVNADRHKIASVVSNLLTNAVKYSPGGKMITVASTIHDKEVWVTVKDEGLGIDVQDKDKLFERYYRVRSDHTKQISGFGVGLYLSAEIVQRHGGRIWVDSEKGVGSTFFFSLPIA